MIRVRRPEDIFVIDGDVEHGTFRGRWHFSFGGYRDPEFTSFGSLRVFNDDILSPGAGWPLHPHKNIEVITYCAKGEFRHADERGKGGVLRQGWAQHTTVGTGMWHSEINNRDDEPMRFIQMWFSPSEQGLKPTLEQLPVDKSERTNTALLIASPEPDHALQLRSDARVYSSFLEENKKIIFKAQERHGQYIYVVDGGPVHVNEKKIERLGAAIATDEKELLILADEGTELLLVDTLVN